jgi:hypothetical protein
MNKKKARKEKKKKILMAIISAIFLISSIAGVVLYRSSPNSNTITLNISNKNYKFTRKENYYSVDLKDKVINVYNLPYELEYINISNNILNKINETNVLYFTFNPNEKELTYIDFFRFDLSESLSELNKYIINGVTSESENYNLPVIDCKNATQFIPVIKLKNSNTTKVYEENNCFIIESRGLGFIKIRDKIIYKLYGLT